MSIVKEIQRHPVGRDVTHVDFLRIDPDQDVTVDVPLVMVGDAKAVTDADGMVDQNLFSLTVNAAPDSIPNELEVDISDLTVGDSLRVADIALPARVPTDLDPEEPVARRLITRSTPEPTPPDPAAAPAAAAGDGAASDGASGAEGSGSSDSGGSAGPTAEVSESD